MGDHLGAQPPQLGLGVGERVGVPVEDRHPRALVGERDGAARPMPGRPATHDDDLAIQLQIHDAPSLADRWRHGQSYTIRDDEYGLAA